MNHLLRISSIFILTLWPVLIQSTTAQPPGASATIAFAPVEVTRVIFSDVQRGQRVVGTVQPLRITTIGSALEGRLEAYHVNDGQRVKQGETLAELRPKTLQLQLAAAEAELRLFESQLEELKNGSLPEEIDEAEANVSAATALMENADRQWQRLRSLSDSRAASITEIENAKEQAEATRFALQASRAQLKRIKDGPRLELIAQAQARVQLQSEQIKQLEDQIDKLAIKAPFDGYIATELTEVGAWIRQGDPIAQVVQLDKVEIQVPATAEYAVGLRIGDQIRVEFPELPQELLVGTIDRIVPVADPQTRTYPVYIQLVNRLQDDRPLLMSGMLARAYFPAGRSEPSALVPKDALVLNGDQRAVFVFQEKSAGQARTAPRSGIVRKVQVELGVAVDGLMQVHGELNDGDLVVVTGNERLIDGAEVSIAKIRQITVPESTSLNN